MTREAEVFYFFENEKFWGFGVEHLFLSCKELNHPQVRPQREEYFLEIMSLGLEEFLEMMNIEYWGRV